MIATEHLLAVKDLCVTYGSGDASVAAVRGVSFAVDPGRCVAIVGESGSGKTTLARALIGTLALHHATVTGGRIVFDGEDLTGLDAKQRRTVHGPRIGYVPQDALTALNPVVTIGNQIGECFEVHRGLRRRDARARAVELLERVGLDDPVRAARSYPHQLSGGMRQRAAIAAAVSLEPALIVADEPTTALDPTVQAEILDLLAALQRDSDLAMLLISHDLGMVRDVADDVVVMYAGEVMERSPTGQFFGSPAHPYAVGLMEATPVFLSELPVRAPQGSPPQMGAVPTGCPYHPRCAVAEPRCAVAQPVAFVRGDRWISCHLGEELFGG